MENKQRRNNICLHVTKEKATNLIFGAVLIFHLIVWFSFCQNTGIKGDEFFSYGLANGTEDYIFWDLNQVKLHGNESGWIAGSDIGSYLCVKDGERFSYDRVWWNQAHDVHPPFYYLLLNTVCSFFTGEYSKWFGKGISLCFLILTEVIMYRISVFFIGKEPLAALPGFLWGISYGTLFLGALVRMYAMLAFFCLYLVWRHICLVHNGYRKKDILLLIVTVTAGGLTHYYFYLFLLLYGGLFFLQMVIDREERKRLFVYAASIFAGGVLALIIFPYSFQHVFGGYRGEDVKSQLFSSNFRWKDFLRIMDQNMFGSLGGIVFIFFLAVCVLFFVLKRPLFFGKTERRKLWFLMAVSGVLYAMAMMKISISARTAYISPCYAILETALYLGIIVCLRFLGERKESILLFLLAAVFCMAVLPDTLKAEQESYEPTLRFREGFISYQGTDCIFVYDAWDNLFANHLDLMSLEDEIYCLDAADIETTDYIRILEGRRRKDELIILIPNTELLDERVIRLEESMQMKAEKVLEGTFFCVFRVFF